MIEYLLDTDICIRALRDRPIGFRERFNATSASICISAVVLAELLYGVGKSAYPDRARAEVERFASRMPVLSFDEAAASHAADIRISLERVGTPIGAHDLLIAGHARSRGLTVVTGNLREFGRVNALKSIEWDLG